MSWEPRYLLKVRAGRRSCRSGAHQEQLPKCLLRTAALALTEVSAWDRGPWAPEDQPASWLALWCSVKTAGNRHNYRRKDTLGFSFFRKRDVRCWRPFGQLAAGQLTELSTPSSSAPRVKTYISAEGETPGALREETGSCPTLLPDTPLSYSFPVFSKTPNSV